MTFSISTLIQTALVSFTLGFFSCVGAAWYIRNSSKRKKAG